jgi:heat-inducible transcriptional repressor
MEENKIDNLLRIIVEEYIKTASPVGSGLVVFKYLPDVSSATIRNYMAELEERDLIFQPHTSSGRVPTTKGYQYYINNFVIGGKSKNKKREGLKALSIEEGVDESPVKSLAKKIADISGEVVLVSSNSGDVYYTGISNLFRQPEFAHQELVNDMSDVIDNLDELMDGIFEDIDSSAQIMIGPENPFGEESSAVIARYESGSDEGVIGILGPNRMNYRENMELIDLARKILSNL